MKKHLLTIAALGLFSMASMAAPFESNWYTEINGAFPADNQLWNAPVAVDAQGNVVASSAFSQDVTVAGNNLEAIGNSAFLVKYNAAGDALWSVAFTGAATISAIDIDGEGNIYVAGSLADEVEFGSTDGNSVVKEGMMIWGEYTINQNAAFIAKYSVDGKLLVVETIIPDQHPELWDIPDYMWYILEDGDIYFEIKQIKALNNSLYVSAVYTGVSEFGNASFSAPYVNYGDFMYIDVAAGSVFEISPDLTEATILSTVKFSGEDDAMVFDTSACWSVRFDVNTDGLVAGFAGSGQLNLYCEDATEEISYEGTNFILAKINKGSILSSKRIECNSATTGADNSIALVKILDNQIILAGRKLEVETVENDGDEIESKSLFVARLASSDLSLSDLYTQQIVNNEISYYDISSALVINDQVYINVFGNYNQKITEGDQTIHENGDFAGTFMSLIYTDAFVAGPIDASWMAVKDGFLATSSIVVTGPCYNLYSFEDTGVDGIIDEIDAEAEYYTLQGVRVAHPDKGIYIVRKGNKVSKQVIR